MYIEYKPSGASMLRPVAQLNYDNIHVYMFFSYPRVLFLVNELGAVKICEPEVPGEARLRMRRKHPPRADDEI